MVAAAGEAMASDEAEIEAVVAHTERSERAANGGEGGVGSDARRGTCES